MSNDDLTATTPAERAKRARRLSGASRKVLEQKYGISQDTLRSWENPARGITIKGAEKLVKALYMEGTYCTVEWLIRGLGPGPTVIAEPPKSSDDPWTEDEEILKEIQLFQSSDKEAVVLVVLDDGMLPHFAYGDYVGGIYRSGADIAKFIKRPCIIDTKKEGILIRTLDKTQKSKNLYTAICTNPATTVSKPIIYNLNVLRVAEIVWHRRKELQSEKQKYLI